MSFQQRGIHVPPLSIINKYFIGTIVAVFLIFSVVRLSSEVSISHYLGLSGELFFSGHIYQLITYSFMATGLFEVLFDCLIIWFSGSDLEQLWGSYRYLKFMIISFLGGGIIFLGISFALPGWTILSGPGGIAYALLLAYSILFPTRTLFLLFFPIKAKWFCLILIAMQFYMGIFTPSGSGAWGHLGSMFSGFLYMLYLSKDSLRLPTYFQVFNKKIKKNKKRDHLKLVKEDEDKPPKYWQ